MKGDGIPAEHHIARFCFARHVNDNGDIQASAFLLREGEQGLSVNWLEYLKCTSRESEIETIRKVYSGKFRSIKAKEKIAVLNVGEVCRKVFFESLDRRKLEVIHEPSTPYDESHSEIRNLRQHDLFIAELILDAVRESCPAL